MCLAAKHGIAGSGFDVQDLKELLVAMQADLPMLQATARRDPLTDRRSPYVTYGITLEELRSGKPIIGIAQTGSDISPCNRVHVDLVRRVRDGVRDAGGIPMEFPTHPIFENCKRSTAALDRNLSYLSLVEMIFGYPIDAVVFTAGCDKTTSAALMAAATTDVPSIILSGGRTGCSTVGTRESELARQFGEVGVV